MNRKMILCFLGMTALLEAGLMLLPALVALIYGETSGYAFLWSIGICLLLGLIGALTKPEKRTMFAKDGFVAVSLCWIVLSLIGALPFTISGEIPHYIDAVFETVSGFTTTGSSILTNVEGLSRCMLFWRSLTHWVGGMGILVFMLAFLPSLGGQTIHLLRAESPGPTVDKVVPRMRDSAKILYLIYLGMTVVLILLYILAGMPVLDSLCIAFGTAGTGGFAITGDSLNHYSPLIQTITTVFMFLFGVNFSMYFFILKRKWKAAFSMSEVWTYFAIVALATLAITLNTRGYYDTAGQALHHAAFSVSSVITTTGYGTVDFSLWPEFSRVILCLLMIVGACAGSTGGGFKVSRVMLLYKASRNELRKLIHPNSVKVARMDGRPVPEDTLRGVWLYLAVYVAVLAGSVLLVSLDNFDASTTVTSVLATLNNIGPGLNMVGPAGSFAAMSYASKIVLILDMLLGRLELFPVLFLFLPSTWLKK